MARGQTEEKMEKASPDPRVAPTELPIQIAVTSDEASETVFVLTDKGSVYRMETPHGQAPGEWVEILHPFSPPVQKK